MINTKNYGLGKPESDEFYNIDVFNNNADIVDTELKKQSDTIERVNNGLDATQNDVTLSMQTLGYVKKNLLKNWGKTQTINSVDFTVNDDGSVTVKGTATANATYYITENLTLDYSHGIILNGCTGGSNDTYYLYLYNDTMGYRTIASLDGDSSNAILSITNKYRVNIMVKSGVTVDTIIYPMIRDARITDGTYEPYVDDVDVRINALNRDLANYALASDVEEIKTSFRDGCDTIVAGCTAYGSTPASNSPDDIVASIGTIYEDRYNQGIEDAEPVLQSKSVSLSTSAQTIKPDSSYDGLSQVTVPAVTGTATTSDVVASKTFASASGVSQTGTLADKTGTSEYTATATLDSTNKELEMTIPATGKYNTSNKLKATFATIASLIGLTSAKLVKGNTILGITGNSNNMDTSGADASTSDVLSGKKVCVDGSLLTGAMTNNGAVAGTISTSGGTYTIPAGYHNGSGKVTGATLATLVGTNVTLASAGNLLTGNTAYGKNGTKYTGSMANKAGTTVDAGAVTSDDSYFYLTPPANGYYSTGSKLRTKKSNVATKMACFDVWGANLHSLIVKDSFISSVTANNTDIQFTVNATGTLNISLCLSLVQETVKGAGTIYKNGTSVKTFSNIGAYWSTTPQGSVSEYSFSVSSGDVIKITFTSATTNSDCKTLLLSM